MRQHLLLIIFLLLFSSGADAKKTSPTISRPVTSTICPNANLLIGRLPQILGHAERNLAYLADGKRYENGGLWDLPEAVLIDNGSSLVFDLGEETPVASAWIQADNNDLYVLEGSRDGKAFSPITTFGPQETMGLQSRWNWGLEAKARYLKLTPKEGDGYYSVSEIGVFCKTPNPFPPSVQVLAVPKESPWGKRINDYRVTVYKVCILAAAILLFLYGLYLKQKKKNHLHKRARMAIWVLLALLAYASYYNFFHWHFENDIHTWEVYHYYMGSKYFPELGYEGLYECTSLADSEDGFRDRVLKRKIRDHRTNEIRPATYILENPNLCKERFSVSRWADFKKDLVWFRNSMGKDRWDNMQKDHGYNPPPVWTTFGRFLTNFFSPNTESIRSLVQLDMLIILVAFGFTGWAFGWETLFLALIIWGTNYPSRYYWIGGAYLRQSWFVSAMIGLSLLKKRKILTGSFFLSLSTAITIFPMMFFAGPVFQMIREWRTRKGLSPELRCFLIGSLVSGILLFGVSLIGTGKGFDAYRGFTRTMLTHMGTPLTNNMGLKTVVAFRPDKRAEKMHNSRKIDPFEDWKSERREIFNTMKPLFLFLILAFFFLFWRAVTQPQIEIWEAAALGFTLIPMTNELTCYYYSFVVAGAFLATKRPQLGLILLLTNLAWTMCEFFWGWFDVKYTYASLVAVMMCFYFVMEMRAKGTKPSSES